MFYIEFSCISKLIFPRILFSQQHGSAGKWIRMRFVPLTVSWTIASQTSSAHILNKPIWYCLSVVMAHEIDNTLHNNTPSAPTLTNNNNTRNFFIIRSTIYFFKFWTPLNFGRRKFWGSVKSSIIWGIPKLKRSKIKGFQNLRE